MAETNMNKKAKVRRIRHRGRENQVIIYLGKQLRFFINENDWKVLPMAAVIAALVGMVIRKRFFINMEGSLIGAFALTCVGIWNGCFNSIQSVCRERPIVKREHRSGMHISAYVTAHMIYQFLLCAAQTGLSMYMMKIMGVQFPKEGFMTSWMIVDIGITLLLITYASDMMSLFISSISHTTTGAMTVMPFILIFQLVFSGGIIPLPAWSQTLSDFTISNYGIRAIAAQSGYNEMPMVTAWNTLEGMRNSEIGGTVTVGQLLDLTASDAAQKRRDTVIVPSYTVQEAANFTGTVADALQLKDKVVIPAMTVEDVLNQILTNDALQELQDKDLPTEAEGENMKASDMIRLLLNVCRENGLSDQSLTSEITVDDAIRSLRLDELAQSDGDVPLNKPITLGEAIDFLSGNEWVQSKREETVTVKLTIGDVFDLVGEENIKAAVEEKTAQAAWKAEYERTPENIIINWIMLGLFIMAFALLATLALELIDKDKR